MFRQFHIMSIALVYGLTLLATTSPTRTTHADTDEVSKMGVWAGWLTACGALDKAGTNARSAFEVWANHPAVFGKEPDKANRFMKFYDFAIGQHAWADNNNKVCDRFLKDHNAISVVNGWLNDGLDLVGMRKLDVEENARDRMVVCNLGGSNRVMMTYANCQRTGGRYVRDAN